MRKVSSTLAIVLAIAAACPTFSGAEGTIDESGTLAADPSTGGHRLSWLGVAGKTYFVQYSDNLVDWEYFSVIKAGDGGVLDWGFVRPGRNQFVRLISTDHPTTEPEGDDFDLDGVNNLDELSNGTDPLASADTDADGLPDDWEAAHGLDSGSPGDASSDGDGDGLTALQEFGHGGNPNRRDSDGDGLLDGYEALKGTPVGTAPQPPHVPLSKTGLLVYCPSIAVLSDDG